MGSFVNVLGVIPARGGSKRIPRKNIKKFAGQPLITHSLTAAIESDCFSRLVVSTEDQEIAGICRNFLPNLVLERPADLALDETPTLPVIQHAVRSLGELEHYHPDVIVVLQPTSPFRSAQDIRNVVRLIETEGTDSVVSVVEVPHQFSPFSVMKIEDGLLHALDDHSELENISQKKPKFYARNGCFNSVCTYECLMEYSSLYGRSSIPYLMPAAKSIDLDSELDWELAENLFQRATREAERC